MITEINLTGATQLGPERGKLLQHGFSCLVASEDGDRWHLFSAERCNSRIDRVAIWCCRPATVLLALAEEAGLILPIGLWELESALSFDLNHSFKPPPLFNLF